ncbi:unnamed protein product [Schistosoma mattheei]|uniref:Uncharacterized protein n=1 Tax=Schistosoma mattheei TaxID=31246 RepID=A0A183NV90_9TREM|nr:unnamed protein product [Schistosoma mattheei]
MKPVIELDLFHILVLFLLYLDLLLTTDLQRVFSKLNIFFPDVVINFYTHRCSFLEPLHSDK